MYFGIFSRRIEIVSCSERWMIRSDRCVYAHIIIMSIRTFTTVFDDREVIHGIVLKQGHDDVWTCGNKRIMFHTGTQIRLESVKRATIGHRDDG